MHTVFILISIVFLFLSQELISGEYCHVLRREVRHLNKGSLLSFFNLIVLEIMAWVAVSLSVKEGKLATCSSID